MIVLITFLVLFIAIFLTLPRKQVRRIKRVNRDYNRDRIGRFAKKQIVWVSDLRRMA